MAQCPRNNRLPSDCGARHLTMISKYLTPDPGTLPRPGDAETVDELGYARGNIDTSLPFAELKAVSRVNDRAMAADQDAKFSRLIRAGIPGM